MKSSLNPLAAAFPTSGSSQDIAEWARNFARSPSDDALSHSLNSSQTTLSPMSPAIALLPEDPFGMANAEGAARLQRQFSRRSTGDQSRASRTGTRDATPAPVATNDKRSQPNTSLHSAETSGKESAQPGPADRSLALILDAARSGLLAPLLASGKNRINANVTDAQGRPALYLVADMTHGPRTLDLLLQHGARIEATDPHGNTPLMLAIKNHKIQAAVNLMLRHANPDTTDANGKSAREVAASKDNPRMVDCLLRFGASPPPTATSIRSNLIKALTQRSIDDIFHLACTFEGKKELKPDGSTAIHQTAAAGDIEILKVLLAAGFRPNTVDRAGNTPMHTAAAAGMENAMQFLLSRGGYATTRNNAGLTPQNLLHNRAQSNSPFSLYFNSNPQFTAGIPRQ